MMRGMGFSNRRGQRRGFGGGGSNFEKPVKEGEEYDVQISEVGSKGDGIAKIKNFVIFVPNTSKGDNVRIRITQVKAKSAVGEVISAASSTSASEVSSEKSEVASQEFEENEEDDNNEDDNENSKCIEDDENNEEPSDLEE